MILRTGPFLGLRSVLGFGEVFFLLCKLSKITTITNIEASVKQWLHILFPSSNYSFPRFFPSHQGLYVRQENSAFPVLRNLDFLPLSFEDRIISYTWMTMRTFYGGRGNTLHSFVSYYVSFISQVQHDCSEWSGQKHSMKGKKVNKMRKSLPFVGGAEVTVKSCVGIASYE